MGTVSVRHLQEELRTDSLRRLRSAIAGGEAHAGTKVPDFEHQRSAFRENLRRWLVDVIGNLDRSFQPWVSSEFRHTVLSKCSDLPDDILGEHWAIQDAFQDGVWFLRQVQEKAKQAQGETAVGLFKYW